MKLKTKLIVECHDKNNIYIATLDSDIPSCDITECPKQNICSLLRDITGYNINPYEQDWISIELLDTEYDKDNETVYIIYVCRVPEKEKLTLPYVWTEYAEIRPKIERLRGLF